MHIEVRHLFSQACQHHLHPSICEAGVFPRPKGILVGASEILATKLRIHRDRPRNSPEELVESVSIEGELVGMVEIEEFLGAFLDLGKPQKGVDLLGRFVNVFV